MKKHIDLLRILRSSILIIGLIMITVPLFLVFINSFKTLQEAGQNFFAAPNSLYLGNYHELIRKNNYFTYVRNSVYVSLLSVVLITVIIPLVAYAISRNFRKSYYRFLYRLLTLGLFIPSQVIILPVVKRMASLNLQNLNGMILLYVTFSFTQGIFLFVNYIRALPLDMEEAAEIDGCNVFQVYFKVVIHLIRPMVATLVIMNILWIWNDFQLPLYILNKSPENWTLPLFQYNFKTQYSFNYTMAFTAYIISMLPVIILYVLMQKNILRGLMAGAIKG